MEHQWLVCLAHQQIPTLQMLLTNMASISSTQVTRFHLVGMEILRAQHRIHQTSQ